VPDGERDLEAEHRRGKMRDKMIIRQTIYAVIGSAGLVLIGAPTTAEAQQPIRIGATMSQTGNLATQGVPASNGYRLCEKHVNEKGGLLGRKIEFVIATINPTPSSRWTFTRN
jgi:ABC-type branched-subunit amino acid transport system substrate-binding protein